MSSKENGYKPPPGAIIHQLVIKPVFDSLEPREKLYAHYLARAAWHGSKIIMRQVSPESTNIFDFIIDLFHACGGKWETLILECKITSEELASFLEYAAMFLCNLGNFYGEGDQKFIPNLTVDALQKIANISPKTKAHLEKIIQPLLAIPPFNLGYPSKNAQSNYYPGTEVIWQEEVALVSKAMNKHIIGPENTRVRKVLKDGKAVYEILQASADVDHDMKNAFELSDDVVLIKGDHSEELSKVCLALTKAKEYTCNSKQTEFLDYYIECFRSGSLEAFWKSQKAWVTDISARVENIMGFIEPYRDPAGIRSEWEAMIGIADPDETSRLKHFVESSTAIIRKLPWAVEGVNDGKGPFEKSFFEAPDLTSCEEIRETCGLKNIVLVNHLNANNNPKLPCYWLDESELKHFKHSTHIVRFITTAIHELIGHGTGKLFRETSAGVYNFDKRNPPISPLSGEPVESHYLIGQTWTSVFGYSGGMSRDLDASEITAEDLLYTTYLNIGVDGLQALEHYNIQNKAWGQVHHQAHFSILKHLLQDGNGVIQVIHNATTSNLTVRIDRNKILSDGKPALGRYLCCLHIWRCTADVSSCKEFYESMCAVDGMYPEWRQIVCSKPRPRWKFVQPNTFIKGDDDDVEVKVYEESNEGVIQSWVDRAV
ncbi:hypothetical protein OCU04_012263 [Sclerotinia nivalis]|uniref:Dipeptidyl peptidase III n=1 Tax=Sclerotinia nivalis TaxID=352851 RepID=A0A9X0DE02_9HELO|nr:hypothetical protein OCU04_012263 [Sclerotinia nivalis]